MEAKTKRAIAREWLILIGGLVAGGFLFPLAVMLVLAHEYKFREFYGALFDSNSSDHISALVLLVGPYLLLQFGRSVRWAYRAVKPQYSEQKVIRPSFEERLEAGQQSSISPHTASDGTTTKRPN